MRELTKVFCSLLIIATLTTGCDNKKVVSNDSKHSSASVLDNPSTEEEFCKSFDIALNGTFKNDFQEGTMTWSGGREGTVEIAGVDYNEMTCTYKVPVCADGEIHMLCNGAAYNTAISLFTADSIMLGTTIYTRVK